MRQRRQTVPSILTDIRARIELTSISLRFISVDSILPMHSFVFVYAFESELSTRTQKQISAHELFDNKTVKQPLLSLASKTLFLSLERR